MRGLIVFCGAVFSFATIVWATTYLVNPEGTGDFPTIQAAIDAVVDGDIIELNDGTFTGDGNRVSALDPGASAAWEHGAVSADRHAAAAWGAV